MKHKIKFSTFQNLLFEMVFHFDNVFNLFRDYNRFDDYATGYINCMFNIHHVVDMENYESLRQRIIDALIASDDYSFFRDDLIFSIKHFVDLKNNKKSFEDIPDEDLPFS